MPFKDLVSNIKERWRRLKPLLYARDGIDSEYTFTPGGHRAGNGVSYPFPQDRRRARMPIEDVQEPVEHVQEPVQEPVEETAQSSKGSVSE